MHEFPLSLNVKKIIHEIEAIKKRLDKIAELVEKTENKNKIRGYELAKKEFELEFEKKIGSICPLLKELKKYEDELKTEIKSLVDEKLKKEAMLEVEVELNEDPKKIKILESDIQHLETRIKELNTPFETILSLKEKLLKYIPEIPTTSECTHKNKTLIATVPMFKRTIFIYECLDCGKRWREG